VLSGEVTNTKLQSTAFEPRHSQGCFKLTLVEIDPVVSEKKIFEIVYSK
jgi:hypothetical protein